LIVKVWPVAALVLRTIVCILRAVRMFGVMVLWVIGCSQPPTSARVVVQDGEREAPGAVTISVFDQFGLLGRSHIVKPAMPGAITLRGLSDVVQTLRVAAVGDPPRMLGGVRFDTQPHAEVVEQVTLRATTPDGDGDGVPDSLDDCPAVADPDQENRDGQGAGDACEGGDVVADLAVPGSADLAHVDLAGVDLAGVDLAGVDLATLDLAQPIDLAKMDLAQPIDLAKMDLAQPIDLARPDLATPPSTDMSNVPVFTEGFENGIMGAVWAVSQTNGSLNIDPSRVHRGQYSLHVHENALAAGGSAKVSLVETQAVPLPDMFIRVFAYVPSGSDPASVAILTVDQASAPHKGINLNQAQRSFSSSNNIPAPPVTLAATTPPMPIDQWVCLEWHVRVAPNGSATLSVNGTEVTALSGMQNTQPAPTVAEIGLGLTASPSNSVAARDVWFDDVAIDGSPIGCIK